MKPFTRSSGGAGAGVGGGGRPVTASPSATTATAVAGGSIRRHGWDGGEGDTASGAGTPPAASPEQEGGGGGGGDYAEGGAAYGSHSGGSSEAGDAPSHPIHPPSQQQRPAPPPSRFRVTLLLVTAVMVAAALVLIAVALWASTQKPQERRVQWEPPRGTRVRRSSGSGRRTTSVDSSSSTPRVSGGGEPAGGGDNGNGDVAAVGVGGGGAVVEEPVVWEGVKGETPRVFCAATAYAPRSTGAPTMVNAYRDVRQTEQSCDDFYGNSWFYDVATHMREVCSPSADGRVEGNTIAGRSRITRWDATTTARFLWMRNVVVNYDVMESYDNYNGRRFGDGFLTASCTDRSDEGLKLAGGEDREPALLTLSATKDAITCDKWDPTPTLVIQHEDIGSMYHNSADLLRVFLSLAILQQPRCVKLDGGDAPPDMLDTLCNAPTANTTYVPPPNMHVLTPTCPAGYVLLRGLDPDDMQLLNLDARIMCNIMYPNGTRLEKPEPDCIGVYFPTYDAWFGKGVVRGLHQTGRVCYAALGWAALAPEALLWRWFGEPSKCDEPSTVLLQYQQYVMARFHLTDVVPAVVPPPGTPKDCDAAGVCKPYIRIIYMRRHLKPFNPNPIVGRRVGNEDAFLAMLHTARPGVQVDVDVAEFTGEPYASQLRRARSAHIMIGVHGAGLMHVIHMPPTDECGGPVSLIEMQPHQWDLWAFRHAASYLKHPYFRWLNTDPGRELPNGAGTDIDLDAVRALVGDAIDLNLRGRRPGCPAPPS